MKTLQELITHIKKHQDAVIILGPGINPVECKYTTEEFNERYNRRSLKRDNANMWNFFNEKIDCEINNSPIYKMVQAIDNSIILDQNINASIPVAHLHGHVELFKCNVCKTIFPKEGIINEDDTYNTECESCGGIVRPTVLLSGERYDQTLFDSFKERLLECHTLILIGMDYSEESLTNLIADYGDMRSQLNAEGNPENERCIVAIQSLEEAFDPNDITFCEFLVKDDIEKALTRLVKEL